MLIRSDNSTVVSAINSGFSKSPSLRLVLREIIDWCLKKNIVLKAEHVPGVDNVLADSLSRFIDKDDWRLCRSVVTRLFVEFGSVDIDRMASSWSKVVPRFNSLYWDADVESVDCFTVSWSATRNWVFPPFYLVDRVLAHIKFCNAWALVILPQWVGRPWWPVVCNEAKDIVVLPRKPDLLTHYVFGSYGLCNFDLLACIFDFRK